MTQANPLGQNLYLAARRLIPLIAPLVLRARRKRGKEHRTRWVEKCGQPSLPRPTGPLIWLHGVGLGEVMSLRGLIAALHDIDHTLHQYHWTEETDVVLDISETEKLIQIFADRMPQNKGSLQHSKKNPFDTKKIVNGLSQQSLDIVYKLYEKDFDLLKYKRNLER